MPEALGSAPRPRGRVGVVVVGWLQVRHQPVAPPTIDDGWVDDVERLDEMTDRGMHLRKQARDAFEVRYEHQVSPDTERSELCPRVLARRDIVREGSCQIRK